MTTDIAIKILNGDILGTTEQTHEAVAMAVKALIALSSTQTDLITKMQNGIKATSAEDKEFLKTKRTIEDFKIGLKVPGKLIPKRIHGGVVLEETTYEMR